MIELAAKQLEANQRAESRIAESQQFKDEWKSLFGDQPIPLSMGYQYGQSVNAYANNVNNTGSTLYSHQYIGARQYSSSQPLDRALALQQLYRVSESMAKSLQSTVQSQMAVTSQALEEDTRRHEMEMKTFGALEFMKLQESKYKANSVGPDGQSLSSDDLDQAVSSILKKSCVSCHTKGGQAEKFPFNTDSAIVAKTISRERWKMAALTSTGLMPPKGHDPISDEDVGILVQWAKAQDPDE